MMTELEFNSLVAQDNRIPLMLQAFADLETPFVAEFAGPRRVWRGQQLSCLNQVAAERFGRYSFIGLPARAAVARQRLRHTAARSEVVTDFGRVVESALGNPLDFITAQSPAKRFKVALYCPDYCRSFAAGWRGISANDAVRYIR